MATVFAWKECFWHLLLIDFPWSWRAGIQNNQRRLCWVCHTGPCPKCIFIYLDAQQGMDVSLPLEKQRAYRNVKIALLSWPSVLTECSQSCQLRMFREGESSYGCHLPAFSSSRPPRIKIYMQAMVFNSHWGICPSLICLVLFWIYSYNLHTSFFCFSYAVFSPSCASLCSNFAKCD